MTLSRPARRRRLRRRIGIGALFAGLLVLLGLAAPALGLIDTRSLRLVESDRAHPPVVAVYVSGDMGLRFGLGSVVVPALAAHGIPVVGVSSPVNFGTRKTRAQVDAVIAGAIRTALARTGARRVILMGQSFGADMVSATAPDLPADLRARIAAISVVVPAQTVYFRSDPTGILYHGSPDARPAAALRALDWAPVVCIYGRDESDSLCPTLRGGRAQVFALPGGHFLAHDDQLVIATILATLRTADPTILA
ncbi:AcvB/VirJ family lysyl-phosphatidylglycerol hydrolase [Sphingomonas sp. 2R-10]|uniref:AcvB/VirJ family lysyl-phosphatidylglycerol hydrolase n=1 Tax=Sphingomonas sp. 2R-10 TaxID=3045148 RepID=UPI000F77E7BB|nr:AcvB/VirJ family lysyl-phosphatidylglycerol hydrolase [Sphingomonas sp. 2R-10]MDJ0277846.1 AcvB/VirJ family lysyl-phosphatidylglycerol hydrolase [Sphingomonas sp. 2R-10]